MIVHPILDFLADVLSVPRRCRSIHLKTYCGLQANECKIVRRYGFSRPLVDFYHVAHKWILSLEVISFLLRPFAATLFFPNPCCRHISLYYKSDSHIAIDLYKSRIHLIQSIYDHLTISASIIIQCIVCVKGCHRTQLF